MKRKKATPYFHVTTCGYGLFDQELRSPMPLVWYSLSKQHLNDLTIYQCGSFDHSLNYVLRSLYFSIISSGREMTLSDFKFIFYMEWGHRLWGRATGTVFLLPAAFFLYKGWITKAMKPRLAIYTALIGFQVNMDFSSPSFFFPLSYHSLHQKQTDYSPKSFCQSFYPVVN